MAKVKYYAKENSTIGTHSFYAVPINPQRHALVRRLSYPAKRDCGGLRALLA